MTSVGSRSVGSNRRALRPDRQEPVVCKFCASANVIKNGSRKGTQYWQCKHCGRGFVNNKALPKKKFPTAVMFRAADAYYASWSLDEIRRQVKDFTGTLPSESTVYSWIRLITRIGVGESQKYRPTLGDIWIAGEVPFDIKGKKYWLLDLVDRQTRFVVAARITRTRGIGDIRCLIQSALDRANHLPRTIVADVKWTAHVEPLRLAFSSLTLNVPSSPIDSILDEIDVWHQFLNRRREVVREFKALKTARRIIDGSVFSYNFLTPQTSLGYRTPAGAAGVEFPLRSPTDIINRLYVAVEKSLDWGHVGSITSGDVHYRSRRRPGRRS